MKSVAALLVDDALARQFAGGEPAMMEMIARLRSALQPFAAAVFNDNGDMTISYVTGTEPYVAAYLALRGHQQGRDESK